MAGYDTSIRVKTNIETKKAKIQIASLENRIVKTADEVKSLRSKMDALKDTQVPTKEYADLDKELGKLTAQYDKIAERQRKFLETGGKKGTSTYKHMEYDLDSLDRKQDEVIAKMKELESSGKAFTLGSESQEYANLGKRLQYKENDLAVLTQKHDLLIGKTGETEESYVRLGEAVRQAFILMGKGLIHIPIATVEKGVQGLISVFPKLGNVVKKSAVAPFKLLGNVAKSAFSKISRNANKSGGILSNFGGKIKNLVTSFFIFNQIRKIFSSTASAIKEGFSNLYNENGKFKSSVDSLKASLTTLENSFAAAFRPLVEVAIPYIQKAVEYVTKLANAFGQLIAAITGQKTYTRAIKQTTDALKEETKAGDKQLSSLDKLNNLTSQAGDDADSGTGSMFEEVPISDKFKNFSQWLKEMWENADFTELGTLLGQKLKTALDNIPWGKIKKTARKIGKSIATLINGFVEVEGLGISIGRTLVEAINTSFEFLNAFVHNLHWKSIGKFIAETINGFFQNIDWKLIYDTFVTGAKGLGDAINSFMDNLDGKSIASAVSNFVNTFVDTIYTFITTVDWKKLGNKFGTTISDAWNGIDWSKAGKTISGAFKAFFDFVGQAIEAVDWWSIGETVKDFLVGIDWAGVAESFFTAIGAGFAGFAAFLGGLLGDAVESAKVYFQEKIEECGGNVVLGILKGISDAIIGIGTWIYDHIFSPFIEGFKSAFGIHSPSTVMAEMGKYIIAGLLNGLKNTWNSIVTWMTNAINWLTSKIQSIFGWIDKLTTKIDVVREKSDTASKWVGASSGSNSIKPRTSTMSLAASLQDVEIPGYATGQVIPRTMKQHLAYLGDNNKETEVVSPLSTMKQAMVEAMAEAGIAGGNSGGDGDIVINIDGREVFRVTRKQAQEYKKRTGSPAFG